MKTKKIWLVISSVVGFLHHLKQRLVSFGLTNWSQSAPLLPPSFPPPTPKQLSLGPKKDPINKAHVFKDTFQRVYMSVSNVRHACIRTKLFFHHLNYFGEILDYRKAEGARHSLQKKKKKKVLTWTSSGGCLIREHLNPQALSSTKHHKEGFFFFFVFCFVILRPKGTKGKKKDVRHFENQNAWPFL